MDSSIKVIIASCGKPVNAIYEYLRGKSYENVVVWPEYSEEFETHLAGAVKAVLVIDYHDGRDGFCFPLIDKAKAKGFKTIVICEGSGGGFKFIGKGADEIISRPKDLRLPEQTKGFLAVLEAKLARVIKDYDQKKRIVKHSYNTPIKKIIAIGSSTGGTTCVEDILKLMPEDAPPIMVVQHMPPVFTSMYSQRLNTECKMTVLETEDGDVLENGKVLIAPGEKQLRLNHGDGRFFASCRREGPRNSFEPSADILFESVAKHAGSIAIGVILTGMGRDGAEGLLKMRNAGAFTLGQDEASSVVYGMPKAAYELGAVCVQGNPVKIAQIILNSI